MPYVKVVKDKAYFKRFQTKYRRRREGKTDYRARKRLVAQAKNKYSSPRYRLVVRFTNKICICQIIYAELTGDKVLCSAYSSELVRYGIKCGLKNYAAAYCTGLLLARRLLRNLGMEEMYEGNDADGEVITCKYGKRTLYVEDLDWDSERRPFRANLDVGIAVTTTGMRAFGALKGACDGGLDVPHSYKRFPGYDAETKEYSAEEHRARIFGEHVAEYMRLLQERDEEAGTDTFEKQFSSYVADGKGPDDLEEMYESCHDAIRADPSFMAGKEFVKTAKCKRMAKRSYKQRKFRVQQKKAWRAWKDEQEEEDDE